MLKPERTLVFNGKTVCFFLNPSDQGEDSLRALNSDFQSIRCDKGTGTVPVILYHSENRKRDAEVFKSAACGRSMHVSAVDQQEIRQIRKLLIPVSCAMEAAINCLIHGCIIVLHFHIFHTEFAVILFEGFAVSKNNHCRYNPCIPEI